MRIAQLSRLRQGRPEARLWKADLAVASLDRACLFKADLTSALLEGTILLDANLSGARLERARLENAQLDGASLDDARLAGAILRQASLCGARLKLAHLAELHGANVELNGPGGLFGLVHAHLVCALRNTSYYEYFPGGSRDEAGAEIGLLNPALPQAGTIAPPDAPGWGAEWDWTYFRKVRVAEI